MLRFYGIIIPSLILHSIDICSKREFELYVINHDVAPPNIQWIDIVMRDDAAHLVAIFAVTASNDER
ncbi:hypothetical protein PGB90_007528 [Kerria lacca]